jgi:putative mRNA 3-end processing factor
MPRLGSWIEPHPTGIYVRPADAWVDPSQPQARALVTHGHADHARGGHGTVWATPETLAIMGVRYGDQNGCEVAYGETVTVGEVEVSFVPAGHVFGSAQIILDWGGERVVVSGDYKRRADPTCEPSCPSHATSSSPKATFGLPVFHHPETGSEVDRLLARLADNPDRCVLVGAYALGKAQRVITEVRRRGHLEPIYYHGAMERLNNLYIDHGIDLGELRPCNGRQEGRHGRPHRHLPAGALNDRWSRRLPDPITAMASGWMRSASGAAEECRAAADHLRPCRLGRAHRHHPGNPPQGVWITHGREDALMHWCMTRQIKARELNLVGYEDDERTTAEVSPFIASG